MSAGNGPATESRHHAQAHRVPPGDAHRRVPRLLRPRLLDGSLIMDAFLIYDRDAQVIDRAVNWETAKAVAKRHADKLGSSTFIGGPAARFTTQVRPTAWERAA